MTGCRCPTLAATTAGRLRAAIDATASSTSLIAVARNAAQSTSCQRILNVSDGKSQTTVECPSCAGTGTFWQNGSPWRCNGCNGTGRLARQADPPIRPQTTRPIASWWRRHFGNRPTFSFSFAHYAAEMSGATIEAEQAREEEERKLIIERWERGL